MTPRPGSALTSAHSGVFVSPRNIAALREAVARAHCDWTEIDLGAVADKRSLLGAFAAALAFPLTFGGNWDALADCLQDLSWRAAGGVVLHLRGAGAYARTAPRDWATCLEILAGSATYWKSRGRPFVALIDGVAGLPEFVR
jgi:hypothetical protein